jgi:hypothetical protein
VIDAPPSDPGSDQVNETCESPAVGLTVDGALGVAATTADPFELNGVIVLEFVESLFATLA